MDDEIYVAAARAFATIEAAVAALPPDELEALRAIAAATDDAGSAGDGDVDVDGFGMGFGSIGAASAGDPISDMFAAMMAYQKMVNREAREDRANARSGSMSVTPARRRFP